MSIHARIIAALLLAACAASGPQVRVRAAAEEGGVRVAFRRMEPGSAGHPARIEAEEGRLEEVVHSPDRLTVSALWKEAGGNLRCAFAYGGEASYPADGPRDSEAVEYVFLDRDGVRVTARLPLANPVRPSLPLVVRLDPALLPARFDGRILTEPETRFDLGLDRDEAGALLGGDRALHIETAAGRRFEFLVGIDPDGTPTATTGYIRRSWGGG